MPRSVRAVFLATVCALGLGGLTGTAIVTSSPAGADTVVNHCTIVSSPTPTHHTKCPGANLSGSDLTAYDLSYADLIGADLSGTTLARCTIVIVPTISFPCSATNFTNAKLRGATISGTPSSCFSFQGNPSLIDVNCTGANFDGADLNHAVLSDDFSTVTFNGASLNRAELSSATFVTCYPLTVDGGLQTCPGTNFTDAIMHRVDLAAKDLATVSFAGADLTGSDLAGATFGISEPPFYSAPTNFHGANLTHVDMADTNIAMADLSASNLERADVTGTSLIPPNQTVTHTSSRGAVVTWAPPPSQPGATPGACSNPSGSTFRIGTTTVTCAVVDGTGHDGRGSFTVTVT